jgi:hypothetical protein
MNPFSSLDQIFKNLFRLEKTLELGSSRPSSCEIDAEALFEITP